MTTCSRTGREPAIDRAADTAADTAADFRDAMRRLVSSVMIITSRDDQGQPHGMAASAVIPVSMDPPSLLVAINRNAGLHSVLRRTRRFCANLLGEHQFPLLAPFSQTALREQRFRSDDWRDAWPQETEALPWLIGAPAVIDCDVELDTDYGTHTLFVGRVLRTRCTLAAPQTPGPLVWLAGQRAAVCQPN